MDISSIPFLATAIALVISWAMFAILCSLFQEGIAQVIADRGRFMKKYLLAQLQDLSNGINWGSMFYLHGTIDLLSRKINKPTSDISPELFAKTIIEVVGSAHAVQIRIPELKDGPREFIDDENTYKHSALYNYKAATQLLKPSDVVGFFSQALKDAELKAAGADEATVYNHLTENLTKWFTEFTERLQLWYKKKIRMRLFIIGILLGVLLNIDSLQLFNFYEQNPESRTTVIRYYESHAKQLTDLVNSLDSNHASQIKADSIIKTAKAFLDSADKLKIAASLPVGFENSIFKKQLGDLPGAAKHKLFYLWLLKILGILVSGFAASFGAPFWFDLLRKAYTQKA